MSETEDKKNISQMSPIGNVSENVADSFFAFFL